MRPELGALAAVEVTRRTGLSCGQGNLRLFVGTSMVANSLLLWTTHALLSLVFVLAPMTEERWLEDQYGQAYRDYRQTTPRFWFRSRGEQT